MKIAFQVEDDSDLAIVRILTQRILGDAVEALHRERRPGGVNAVRSTLTAVAWEFWRSDARGLVIVIDNDDQEPTHDDEHEGEFARFAKRGCNYCQLREALPILPERPELDPLQFAIGVAVQQLEAWLLFGAHLVDRKREVQPEKIPATQVKQRLYGILHVPRAERVRIAVPIAERVDLDALAQACRSFYFFRKSVLQLKSN